MFSALGEGKDTITDNVGEHNALQFGQNISVNDLHIDAITVFEAISIGK